MHNMHGDQFVDYYEVMQLSPNADIDTVHRVYRLLAQRFHPDQRETGDAEAFHQITEAYRVLSDPEKRAAFDIEHGQTRRLRWKIFDQASSTQGVEAEARKRQGVLALLYRQRTASADQPSVTLKEMEDLLGVPKEHLEFTLWYLKESQCIVRADNARFAITLKGVELAESMLSKRPDITPVGYIASPAQLHPVAR